MRDAIWISTCLGFSLAQHLEDYIENLGKGGGVGYGPEIRPSSISLSKHAETMSGCS